MMMHDLNSDPLFTRSLPLLGEDCARRLSTAKVAIFGLGGVGSFAAEALARLGVGSFLLVDGDTINPSNLNRQLYALRSTIGELKTELARERILDINPDAQISLYSAFVADNEIDKVLSLQTDTDVIIDAIDSVKTKVALIAKATKRGTPVFSSMGAGFKIDPTKVRCQDLSKTHTDPLARIMRRELKAQGIVNLPVVFSDELPGLTPGTGKADSADKSAPPASCSLVPPAFGLALASLVLQHLLNKEVTE